jgi:RHS repeat-associated protein
MTSLSTAPTGSKLKLDFLYDSQGRRIQKIVSTNNGSAYYPQSTNRFVYDGWNLSAILNSSFNLQNSFMWGLDLSGSLQAAGGVGGLLAIRDITNGVHFAAYDGNGNVCALVNAGKGTVAAQFEYGPFGEVIRATGLMAKANPFRFSTKYKDDETDLLYYGYRYYNPPTGRWLSRDPIGERGGLNLYGAVASDPVDAADAIGLKKCGIRWMSIEYSQFTIIIPPRAKNWGATWHVDENVTFRNDGDYDPCCCEVQRLVSATPTSLVPTGSPEHDDGISRADNDADPGYPKDCHRPNFHFTDDPTVVFGLAEAVDFSFTSTFRVFSDGKPASHCPCETQGEVARISHTVHLTGKFPKLNANDTIPAQLFTGTISTSN